MIYCAKSLVSMGWGESFADGRKECSLGCAVRSAESGPMSLTSGQPRGLTSTPTKKATKHQQNDLSASAVHLNVTFDRKVRSSRPCFALFLMHGRSYFFFELCHHACSTKVPHHPRVSSHIELFNSQKQCSEPGKALLVVPV